jgi:hypothetical protein
MRLNTDSGSTLGTTYRKRQWLPGFLLAWFVLVGALGFFYNLYNAISYLNSWTIGDWLISYAGGFVRRGLPGQVLFALAKAAHVSPIYIIWIWCCIAFVLLAVLLYRLAGSHLDPVLLASPFCLLMPLLGDYFFRKDVTIALLYGLCLLIFLSSARSSEPHRQVRCIVGVNCVGILAVLSHESFLFFGLPSLLWIAPHCFMASPIRILSRIPFGVRGVIYLFPVIIASISVLIFKGSGQHALLIHHAWQQISELFTSQAGLTTSRPPDGAINALGWSLNQQPGFVARQFAMPISYAFGQSPALRPAIPVVLPWLITLYVVVLLFCAGGCAASRDLRIRVVMLQLCCVAPLFLVGVDFGRWIFLLTTSSVLLYGFLVNSDCLNGGQNCWLSWPPFVYAKGLIPSRLRLGVFSRLSLLFLGIPACCWSIRGFGLASPIGYPYKFFVICLLKGNCAG